ncbi:unnamed protein product [Hermetia illucens]|uniref:Uncharacterized protein n=1 Tax=Hermetia illucens TaxID=343691 RepID=A0A7R8YWP6_HERIL|nr:unnamed protein product [Hermetia illucens]
MDITDPLSIAYNRWMFPEDWVTQDDDPRKSLRLISSENPNDLDWDCMSKCSLLRDLNFNSSSIEDLARVDYHEEAE